MTALHKQLEEKPAKVAAQERVQGDITSLEEKIESSDLSSSARDAAESNLEEIRTDLNKLQGAHGEKASKLKQAVKLRMTALHKQLEEKPANVAAQERVQADITSLEEKIESSDLSKKARSAAEINLEEIRADLNKLQNAHGEKASKLKQDVKLRMTALHKQLEDKESAVDNDDDFIVSGDLQDKKKAAKLETEVAAVKRSLGKMHLSKIAKMGAQHTIAGLEEDAAKVKRAHSKAERQSLIHRMKSK